MQIISQCIPTSQREKAKQTCEMRDAAFNRTFKAPICQTFQVQRIGWFSATSRSPHRTAHQPRMKSDDERRLSHVQSGFLMKDDLWTIWWVNTSKYKGSSTSSLGISKAAICFCFWKYCIWMYLARISLILPAETGIQNNDTDKENHMACWKITHFLDDFPSYKPPVIVYFPMIFPGCSLIF